MKKNSKEKTKLFRLISRILLIIQILFILASLFLLNFQIKDYMDIKNAREFDIIYKFSGRFNSDPHYEIAYAIEQNKPILEENGGKFNENELDIYLGEFNILSDIYDKKLISKDFMYNNFSELIEKTYKNAEIKKYLTKIRFEDPEYFLGLDYLAGIEY